MTNIKAVRPVGKGQTYDLEVDHPDHQYYLSNGMLSSNSHAVLYSMISFQTAYLKANFPLEFLVSNLMAKVNSSNPKAKDEVIKIKQEIRALGVKIVPPDINRSEMAYKIIDDKTLMTGLDSLRNVKDGAIEEIMNKRPFKSFKDLVSRTDSSNLKSPAIQALAAAGALDSFKMKREHMFFYCSDYRAKLKALKSSLEKRVAKMSQRTKTGKIYKTALTHEQANEEFLNFEYPFPEKETSWKPFEVFAMEEKFMGEGVTGSVQDRFPRFFDRDVTNIVDLSDKIEFVEFSEDEKENKRANTHNIENHGILGIKGIITSVFEFKVKKEESKIFGQVMAILEIEDPFGNSLKVIAFPDAWQRAKDRIEKELSGGKAEVVPGIAVNMSGFFQWENSHAYSLILGDILSYKEAPKPPKSLASKKVKIPRKYSVSKVDVEKMSKEDLAEALEDDMVFDGASSLDDDYDFR